mgnify:CR=1 FL=1
MYRVVKASRDWDEFDPFQGYTYRIDGSDEKRSYGY